MRVAVYQEKGSPRSRVIAGAMAEGARRLGWDVEYIKGFKDLSVRADAAIAYGWAHPDLFQAYRAAGRSFVYVDLGWWDRKPPDAPWGGYHKVVVNGREPGPYFRRGFPGDRLAARGVEPRAWGPRGQAILLAGMSAKSAGTRGYGPQEWERTAIDLLRLYTERPIIYRPKPSWAGATEIPGTRFSPATEALAAVLAASWAVVTLHSNVAVDALVAGVPIFCAEGVAAEASAMTLENIVRWPDALRTLDAAVFPEPPCRRALLADVAYCQWSVGEMQDGTCLQHLARETPLCG